MRYIIGARYLPRSACLPEPPSRPSGSGGGSDFRDGTSNHEKSY